MNMELIVTERCCTWATYHRTGGAETLSAGEATECDLESFLEWLSRQQGSRRLELDDSNTDLVIHHWNEVDVEVQRTIVTCDDGNRAELLAALRSLIHHQAA